MPTKALLTAVETRVSSTLQSHNWHHNALSNNPLPILMADWNCGAGCIHTTAQSTTLLCVCTVLVVCVFLMSFCIVVLVVNMCVCHLYNKLTNLLDKLLVIFHVLESLEETVSDQCEL